ncbi:LysE family translocator [Vibrio sp. WXL210]|uniref:LysE family translocator n=1 Tax=Vibrio sp. WXL210 TaxID=3450709 RepID=UPI003EC5B428
MTLSIWFSLFLVCLLGAMSPGPSLAMVAKHSLAGGRINGLATAWAHAIGIGFYAMITITGLGVLLEQAPVVFKIITLLGAGYLAYLGWNALRSKGGVVEKLDKGQPTSTWQAAREGLMIALLSPKIMVFFTALFSQFVALADSLANHAVIVLTPLIVDGLWYTLITLLLSSAALLERVRSRAQLIDRLTGVVLIALAVRVVATL